MIRFAIAFILSTFSQAAFSQPPTDSALIDVAAINDSAAISSKTFLYVDKPGNTPIEAVAKQPFLPLRSFPKRRPIPDEYITQTFFLKFSLFNSGAAADTVFLYPGFLFSDIKLYEQNNDSIQPVDVRKAYTGYINITLGPRQIKTFLIRLQFAKIDYAALTPRIINDEYLPVYEEIDSQQYGDLKVVCYILSGVLLMIVFFTLANFLLSGKKEFIYYCGYALCMFALVFVYALLYKQPTYINSLFLGYFDFFFLMVGTVFYIEFTRKFLDTPVNYKILDKIFVFEKWFLIALLILHTFLHFFTHMFWLENLIENSMKFIALAIGVVYVVIAIAQKKRLLNYLALGNTALIIFSFISLALIWGNVRMYSVWSSALFYYDVGLVLGLIFFLVGLTYKNRAELIERTKIEERMKLEAKKKEYESQLAILKAQQEVRNRISADMHDDLGAGMTSIRLYSELAKNKLTDKQLPEIDKISSSANELLNKMNAIIWSMSSSNDSLGNMVAYIRSYALEYFENTGIKCTINLPDEIPHVEVSGEIRRNVFLVVKETLNNVLKHSGATEVVITLLIEGKLVTLQIQDNGRGIDFEKLRQFGNGLKNMKKRMDDVEIDFSIENKNGTLITLRRVIRD